MDPGEKRLGIALSDPSGTIASPLMVLSHVSKRVDAATIADLATQHQAQAILIGKSLDDECLPSPSSRLADRLAQAVKEQSSLPVILWDETFSTQAARQARLEMGVTRKKRRGHLDDLAAAIILQSYLDSPESRQDG